jgi:hypothetical protein
MRNASQSQQKHRFLGHMHDQFGVALLHQVALAQVPLQSTNQVQFASREPGWIECSLPIMPKMFCFLHLNRASDGMVSHGWLAYLFCVCPLLLVFCYMLHYHTMLHFAYLWCYL